LAGENANLRQHRATWRTAHRISGVPATTVDPILQTATWSVASYLFVEDEVIAMAKTAADLMIEALIDWEVDIIFGLPGDGINGIMESLRTHREQIRFIQVRKRVSAMRQKS